MHSNPLKDMELRKRAQEILEIQRNTINNLKISDEMLEAVNKLIETRNNKGRIILTGMGKAGIIGFKMSATLASIGFPSFFVSPAEAAHGDLGRIAPEDLVIVFSNSGSTGEVVSMITHLHALNSNSNFIITIGSSQTPKIPSDLAVSYGKVSESCIVSKVPSTTTTLMLIVADIVAITAAESTGFHDPDFKVRHPGGAIGQAYTNETK